MSAYPSKLVANRVLLVDDVDDIRTIVRHALRRRGGFDVVAEAADGGEAITKAGDQQPDLIVLDLGLPDLAGREVMSRLRAVAPGARIVVFTGAEVSDRADIAREADALVVKDADVD